MMIRKPVIYIVSLIFLLSCEVEISEEQASTFIKFYGSYLFDTGKDVVATADEGFAIAGTSVIPDSVSAMALYITDRYGNLMSGYPKYFTDGRDCGARSILKLADGYLLSGYTMVAKGGGEFQEDIYIVRTDNRGIEIWSSSYGGLENENVKHVIPGNSGGFIIAGYREFNKEKDYWIFRINDAGQFIREVPPQSIPDTDDDMAEFLISIPGLGYLCVCTYDEDTYGGTNVLILSINNDLNSPYNLPLGTDYNDFGRCIIRDGEESFLVLGNTDNESTRRSEISVYKIEMNGLRFENSSLVATIQSGFEDLKGERMVKSGNGVLAITGSSYANEDYNMLLQFVEEGAPSERVYFGDKGTQTGSGIINSDDGGLVILGSNAFEGNSMISLVKTSGHGEL